MCMSGGGEENGRNIGKDRWMIMLGECWFAQLWQNKVG